ncbi:MAG: PEP-CTERM sorting domain-containing protein [Fimbriimonadaceae bacterium]
MTRSALTISTLIVGTALSAFASADNLKFLGLDYSGTLSGNVTYFNSATHSDQSENVYIGKLLFQDGASKIATVCADLSSPLNSASNPYTASFTNPLLNTNLSKAGDIVAADFNHATNAQSGAALQLAVWSALYNGGSTFNANGPDFKVSGISNSVLQQAATYYKDFNVKGSAEYFNSPSGCGGQSQLTVNPTPEPASMAALGIGIAGLIARRRKARA